MPRHFNPRIPYGMRRTSQNPVLQSSDISIHASRMGCDFGTLFDVYRIFGISIHASRMGCDLPRLRLLSSFPRFQSTHPVWDATCMDSTCSTSLMDFNPRIPYGMRPSKLIPGRRMRIFQSTHPVWDATPQFGLPVIPRFHFNPRIPYGMRLREWTLHSIIWKFLPALRADYIADIPEHLSVCIFGL